MTISHLSKDNIVINALEDGDDFGDFLRFIDTHIHTWKDVNVLWDMNKLDFDNVSSDAIRQLIHEGRHAARHRPNMKTAYVVHSDLGFGMMRMFALLAETDLPIIFSVFRDRDTATAWVLADDGS